MIFGLFAVIALIICSLCHYMFFRQHLHKITALHNDLSISKGDVSHRITVTQMNDEIDEICSHVNDMLDTIQNNIIQSYIAELDYKNAQLEKWNIELYALQSQIDPHFLYNTLEMIRMRMSIMNDADGAYAVQLLGRTLRSRIKNDMIHTLDREISQCYTLVELYNISSQTNVFLETDAQPGLLNCAVLQDTLIPLVENILSHVNRKKDLQINISVTVDSTDMTLYVQDNGQGFDPERLQYIRQLLSSSYTISKKNIGLMNLHRRLKLVYGDDYGVTICNNPNGGAMVQVHIRKLTLSELRKLLPSAEFE